VLRARADGAISRLLRRRDREALAQAERAAQCASSRSRSSNCANSGQRAHPSTSAVDDAPATAIEFGACVLGRLAGDQPMEVACGLERAPRRA
jgi:hypothetical protein